MAKLTITIILVLTVFSSIPSCLALSCYNCVDGSMDEQKQFPPLNLPVQVCADPLVPHQCNNLTDFCYIYAIEVGNKRGIARGCGFPGFQSICDAIENTRDVGGSVACSTCTTDNCNSASTAFLSLFLLVGTFLLAKTL